MKNNSYLFKKSKRQKITPDNSSTASEAPSKSEEQATPIEKVPLDIANQILHLLPPNALAALSQASKHFKKLINMDRFYWQLLNEKIWGATPVALMHPRTIFINNYKLYKLNLQYIQPKVKLKITNHHVNLNILIKLQDMVGITKILANFFSTRIIDYKDANDDTPYSLAIKTNDLGIVKLIFGHRKESNLPYLYYLIMALDVNFEIAKFIAQLQLEAEATLDPMVLKKLLDIAIGKNNLPMVKWLIDQNLKGENSKTENSAEENLEDVNSEEENSKIKLDEQIFIKLIELASRNGDIVYTMHCVTQFKAANHAMDKENLNKLILSLNLNHFEIKQYLINQFDTIISEDSFLHVFTLAIRLSNLIYAQKILENIHNKTKALCISLEEKCETVAISILEFYPFTKNVLYHGDSLLSLAAKQGLFNAAVALIARNCLVAGQNKNDIPLLCAAEGGCLQIVQLLIEKKVAVNAQRANGKTALHIAAEIGRSDIVELLTTHGADVDKLTNVLNDTNTKYPAWYLAANKGHWKVAFYLLKKTKYLNGQANSPIPLLIFAHQGREDIVAWLLKSGAQVNRRSREGSTALHRAAENGQLAIVKLLINANINMYAQISPTHVTYPNAYAFEIAMFAGHVQVAEYILVNSINSLTSHHFVGIYEWAKKHNHDDVLNSLMEKDYGNFLFRIAVDNLTVDNFNPYIRALVAIQDNDLSKLQEVQNNYSIDINYVTKWGVTLLNKALKLQHLESAEYLIVHGAKLNLKDIESILDYRQWPIIKILFDLLATNELALSSDIINLLKNIKILAKEDIQCSLPPAYSFAIIQLFEQHEPLLDHIHALANKFPNEVTLQQEDKLAVDNSLAPTKQKTNFNFFEEKPAKKQKIETSSPSNSEKSESLTP